jgi:FtsP/CotA-like multicopper oxidase with cupredoxin domain
MMRGGVCLSLARWVLLACCLVLGAACSSREPAAASLAKATPIPVLCGAPRTQAASFKDGVSVDSLKLPETNAPTRTFTLRAQVLKRPGMPDSWAFNGSVPGPELRVNEGEHVHVVLINELPVPTTIHWHGLELPNSADGVAGMTQDAVAPGDSYTYDFLATVPGTYWYHSHQDTSQQVPRGLYGPLVIVPKAGIAETVEYTLVYGDYAYEPLRVRLPAFLGRAVSRLAGSRPDHYILVNGKEREWLAAAPGQAVRLRIVDAFDGEMTGDPIRLAPLGVPFRVAALDGHDLHEPQEISRQVLPVGEGQRYDVTFVMPASGAVRILDVDNAETVVVGGAGPGSAAPQGAPGAGDLADLKTLPLFDLTRYGTPAEDPIMRRTSFDADYTINLAYHTGRRDGALALLQTINGKQFPDVPMIMVEEGQVIRLHISNPKPEETHMMHLHGHTFTVLARNGVPLSGSPVHLDTLLVAPGDEWDVAFPANNPGIWMFHCHILMHAVLGMDMMVNYGGIVEPYRVGGGPGNVPE